MRTPEEIVNSEVFCCASHLIKDLCALYWSELRARHEANQIAYPKLRSPDLSFGEDEVVSLQYCEGISIEYGSREVFEHWIVSDWLAKKLIQKQESVTEIANLNIWNRTTTGQMIAADEVMQSISEETK